MLYSVGLCRDYTQNTGFPSLFPGSHRCMPPFRAGGEAEKQTTQELNIYNEGEVIDPIDELHCLRPKKCDFPSTPEEQLHNEVQAPHQPFPTQTLPELMLMKLNMVWKTMTEKLDQCVFEPEEENDR